MHVWWDLEDDPRGNVQHIAAHGLTMDDVEDALRYPIVRSKSRSTGMPLVVGETRTGKTITVVFEDLGNDGVRPITAFEVDP